MRVLLSVLLLGLSSLGHALEVQNWTTESGARVVFVQAPQLPIVDIRVAFDAGSARDGEYPGIAYLFTQLLDEGAGDWNADELAQRLESQGIQIEQHTGRDMSWVSLRSLSDKNILTLALDTLATMLARPRLEAEAIERIRQQMLAGISLDHQSPGKMARKALWQRVFGNHPYAHDPKGSPDSLARIGRAELQAFQSKYFVAANAVIAIVGSIDRAQAEQLANRLVADLPVGKRAPVLAPPKLPDAGSYPTHFEASQTHLYLGMPTVSYKDEQYFSLLLGNHILGGSGLTSILGEEVRNQRGLSYSVYSHFRPLAAGGIWFMTAQTQNDQAASALKLMLKLYRQFLRDGPDEKQLEAARKHLVGGFPLKLASNKKILTQILLMSFYDLPGNWLDVYTTRLEQLDVKQVKAAFNRLLSPKHLVQVQVGGAK